jgi:hypothetical protein
MGAGTCAPEDPVSVNVGTIIIAESWGMDSAEQRCNAPPDPYWPAQ